MNNRYTVQSLNVWGTEYHIVWDNLLGRKHPSAAWLTERYAQEDADDLNAAEEVKTDANECSGRQVDQK